MAIPLRHSINGDSWTVQRRDYAYYILTWPFKASMYGGGLHAVNFPWNEQKRINAERAHVLVDDMLSAQGSCWFQHRETFLNDGPLDDLHYGFYGEAQETMLRRWIRGGRCVVNKKTWYAHYHKSNNNLHTADGRVGKGYSLPRGGKNRSETYATDYWLRDRDPRAARTFRSLIEQFWPLIAQMQDERYAWPADWREQLTMFQQQPVQEMV
jgi:hypothetical protein